MAYLPIDKALQTITDNNLIYWKVTEPNNSHPLLQQREDLTINKSVEILEDFIRELEGGYVTITASPTPTTGRGGDKSGIQSFRVKLAESNTSGRGRGINGHENAPAHFYDQLRTLEVRLAEQAKDREIEALKRKLEEQNQESPTDKIISGLLPIMTQKWGLAPAATQTAPPPIAGHDEPSKGKRIEAALVRLNKHIEDLPGTLEKLANWADKDPAQVNNLLLMIPE